jgi:amino acid transporter
VPARAALARGAPEAGKIATVTSERTPTDEGGAPPAPPQTAAGAAASARAAAEARHGHLGAYVLPEPFAYRLKKRLLGPPITTERLSEERLGKIAALGVLAPDCISSTAYGSEEMLNQMVGLVGMAAFSLLLPITGLVLVVLFFVTLSYREVVMVYTKAGGAYVVTRDNFGPRVAQIAAVALIIDYIVTVAVQTVAGTDALSSAAVYIHDQGHPGFPTFSSPFATILITVVVVVVLVYGNLRGIREAGKAFALPTYLFVGAVGALVVTGIIEALLGQLHAHAIPHHKKLVDFNFGYHSTSGLLLGASILMLARAFANGGSSLTGLEAISNGVANFREPTGYNARRTLVIMSITLGSLVLGVSILAHITHAVPYISGTPTVLSQEATYVFGTGMFGHIGFYAVQATTMLILYTGANTSFNGFPNLASFVAQDAYLPRQLTRRGHRLVFSNGIIILAVVSIALIVGTGGNLTRLVALYAIGVFTGFTMAGAGMVKHHLTHREKGWQHRIVINGFASVLSFSVVAIFAITKFTEGAWLVVVLFPILVVVLLRLHKQYEEETTELESNAARAAVAPVLRRHVVLVFVERLDLATARALQYARTLAPDELRAVHFVLDTRVSAELEAEWSKLGLTRFPLDLLECQDRRITRASMELVAEASEDGQTEVSVLLPRRVFEGAWRRVLHDRTADRIAGYVSQLPNANATIVPFPLGNRRRDLVPWKGDAVPPEFFGVGAASGRATERTGRLLGRDTREGREGRETREGREGRESRERTEGVRHSYPFVAPPAGPGSPGQLSISELEKRQRARVAGRVRSVRVQAGAGVPSVECVLADTTGQLLLVFQGRRRVPGIDPGAYLAVEGMVGERGRRMVMINPLFTIIKTADHGDDAPPPPAGPAHRR